MNFYRRYIGDYQRDTGHLSMVEHGAYNLMMDVHYATERPLPKGDALYRLVRAVSKEERAAVDSILAQFWDENETGWVSPRCVDEIQKATGRVTTNQANGRRGGKRIRTESVSKTEAIPLVSGKKSFDLDPRINPDLWQEFEEHRREIKKPLTDRARKANAEILAALTPEQQIESVKTTISNRWTGLFPPKHGGNGSHTSKPSPMQRAADSLRAGAGRG